MRARGLDDEALIGCPGHELVGPGADRLRRHRVRVGGSLWRQHFDIRRQGFDQLGKWFAGLDTDCQRVNHLDLGDRLQEGGIAVLDARIDVPREAELDCISVEGLAIVEADPGPQLQLPGGIVECFPAGGQAWLEREIEVTENQTVIDGPQHAL